MATFLPAFRVPTNAMLEKPLSELGDAVGDIFKSQRQREQREYSRNLDAEKMDMTRQQFAGQQEDRDDRRRTQRIQSLAGLAQFVDQEQDPNVRAQRWGTLLQSDPRLAKMLPEQYRDPINGPKFLIAEAQGYQDPLKTQQAQAQLELTRAQTAQQRANGGVDYGKTGSVFQGPDGQFYTIQFGSDGSRRIAPVVTGSQALSPSKGVAEVDTGTGTRIIDKATGQDVREIGKNLGEAERQKVEGRNRAELQAMAPKAQAALSSLDASHDVVDQTIDRVLPMVDGWTAGAPGTLLRNIPGTAARNVEEMIKTIRANIGFDKLQDMRANSPTGGALGQVAVQELEMLQAVIGSLSQAQTPEQLKAALLQVKSVLQQNRARRRQAFEQTFGGTQPQVPVSGDQPPQGVDPADWQYMTPEERALFR